MKVKMIKFNLPLDDESCKTVEEIRDNFNLPELIEHFMSGRLSLWCRVRKLEEVMQKLEEIEKSSEIQNIAENLCDIFKIDKIGLVESVMVYEYNRLDIKEKEEEAKNIFKKYAKVYMESIETKIKEEEKEAKIQLRSTISKERIKCIEFEVTTTKSKSKINYQGKLENIKYIPLLLTFESSQYVNEIRYIDINSKVGSKHLTVVVAKKDIQAESIKYQMHNFFNEYMVFDGIKIPYSLERNPMQNITSLYLYVYDISNEIEESSTVRMIATETVSGRIIDLLDKTKLLKSIENA